MTEPAATRKTKTAWKERAVHKDMTLPSGMVVDVRLPNLPQLLKAGDIPNALVDAAIQLNQTREVTREFLEQEAEFLQYIVPQTVVAPKITEEDVPGIPAQDLDLIASWIARTNDEDAVGKQLGGLESNAAWRRFRGRQSVEEIAADLQGNGEGATASE